MIIELSTIIGVTGNGGYKLGVNALITKINLKNTIIREHREYRELGRERERLNVVDCSSPLR